MRRRVELGLLVLVLLLAAALRMGWPGISEFKRDEALLSQAALEMARGKGVPLHGITSSVGVPNSPLSVYLFAIPYALSPDPTLAAQFVGALNVVAVALTWWLARRYFGAWAGLAAALLYAASPWGVLYARKVWAQDALPPFVLLTVITGLVGFVERGEKGKGASRWRWQATHLVLLALTVQIHLSAVSLVPLTLVMAVIGRRSVATAGRRLWLGVVLAALTFVPVAVAAVQGEWWGAVERVLTSGGRALSLSADALHHAHLVVAGVGIHALAGPEGFSAYLASVPDVFSLLALVGWLALAAALGLIVSGARSAAHRERLILGLWAALPVLTFTVTWTPSYPHYMIPLIPAGCIALAGMSRVLVGVARQGGRAARALRPAGLLLAALAILVAATQVYVTLALLSFLDTHDTTGGFGTPLHNLLQARDAVLELAAGDSAEILVYGEGEDPDHDADAAVWRFLLIDHAPGARFVDARRSRVYPAGEAVYLQVGARRADFQYGRVGEPVRGELFHMGDAREGEGAPIGRRLANGITLDEWGVADHTFWLRWSPPGPADRLYTLFVHLLDAEERRIAQVDVPAWRGPWRAGDRVVSLFDLGEGVSAPEGKAWRVGMYFFDDEGAAQGVDVLDEAGNPAGWWVDLPAAAR